MTGAETNGARSVWVEGVPAGAGPPRHIHHAEDELFYVIVGRFWFVADDTERALEEGGVKLVPRGKVHCFKNIGDSDGELLVEMTPGGLDAFFVVVEAEGLAPRDGMERIAALAAQYNLEFVGPPLE
ncbi:MAG: cupin domain-containing protein [Pseudomonadota bacterium]